MFATGLNMRMLIGSVVTAEVGGDVESAGRHGLSVYHAGGTGSSGVAVAAVGGGSVGRTASVSAGTVGSGTLVLAAGCCICWSVVTGLFSARRAATVRAAARSVRDWAVLATMAALAAVCAAVADGGAGVAASTGMNSGSSSPVSIISWRS